jgi:hypothetical protein
VTSDNILFGEPAGGLFGAGGGALTTGRGYPKLTAIKAFSEGFLFMRLSRTGQWFNFPWNK